MEQDGKQIIVHTRTQVGLYRIHRPNVRAVIHNREAPDAITKFLDFLPDQHLPCFDIINFLAHKARDYLQQQVLHVCHEPHNPLWQGIINDIADHITTYAKLSGAGLISVFVRNSYLGEDRLHTDGTALRMIIPYVGQGTQYMDGGEEYKRPPKDSHVPERIDRFPNEYDKRNLRTLNRFHAMLFKGRDFPHEQPAALFHKCPDRAEFTPQKGDPRLLVLINGATPEEIVRHTRHNKLVRAALG